MYGNCNEITQKTGPITAQLSDTMPYTRTWPSAAGLIDLYEANEAQGSNLDAEVQAESCKKPRKTSGILVM